jgi:hypothetical protein
VPLDARIASRGPLLFEDDVISLSRDFALSGTAIQDIPLGVTHRVRPSATALLFALHDGTTYRTLLRLARMQKISDSQLSELMGFLNMIGALERRRGTYAIVKGIGVKAHHALLGVYYTPLAWRQPATPFMVALGVIRAIRIVGIGACAVGAAAIGSRLAPASYVAILTLFGLCLLAFTLFIHELVHVRATDRRYVQPRVLQIGFRLGVIHRKLTPQREVLSAVGGPVAGSLCGCAFSLLAYALHAYEYSAIGMLIVLIHFLSLTPWYGDGASLYKALQERKYICNK